MKTTERDSPSWQPSHPSKLTKYMISLILSVTKAMIFYF